MGACLSCLGLGPSTNQTAEVEPSETSRLLREEQRDAEYGAIRDPDLMPIEDLDAGDEPREQEQQDRAFLNNIWRFTSDKLIDISHLANLHDLSSDEPAEPDVRAQTSQDYQRFFDDTFPGRPRSGGRPAIQKDTFVPPEQANGDAGGTSELQNEHDWLRNIILRDPHDKSWDCNTVLKIGKPLVMNFQEAVENDEHEASSNAVKALKGVTG